MRADKAIGTDFDAQPLACFRRVNLYFSRDAEVVSTKKRFERVKGVNLHVPASDLWTSIGLLI